jgi:hypothetical protein
MESSNMHMMSEHNEDKDRHHRHEGPDHPHVHHDDRPYWKRAHHDWRFWVGVVFMLAAMTVYVGTNNLSLVPYGQSKTIKAAHAIQH